MLGALPSHLGRDTPLGRQVRRIGVNIVAHYRPAKIVLFGSMARGDAHEGSDVDLTVVKEREERFIDRIGAVLEACGAEIEVEALVYTPAELARLQREGRDFIVTALAEGIVLYEDQG